MTIMAYVDKARVEGTLYDISPSPTGNLDSTSENAYTSSDVAQANATTWTDVNPILATEQHRSIFSKITSMIKNVRYLYNLVGSGTFAPGNGTTITDVVNNKAPTSHTHTTSQLPISNSQINSTSYVPTSALIYHMNQTLSSLNDAIEEIEENMPPIDTSDPNDRLPSRIVYTISSITDANQFCNTYNHNNNYNGLMIGNRIQINDGVYNKAWYIAGFDMEYNHRASDGTIKDNGYGICLIPENYVINADYHNDSKQRIGYIQSTMHTSTLPTVANNLKNVLGSHLINRNVLLSSSMNENGKTTSYTWTNAYCTLMSEYQVSNRSIYSTQYDTGEANYYLPIFLAFRHSTSYGYWIRSTTRTTSDTGSPIYEAYVVLNEYIRSEKMNRSDWNPRIILCARPMIYIR